MKNIVIIGGGTGTFTLLSGLRKFPSNNSVIVSSADDGGSTGRLRKDLKIFPVGDLRQCLLGLSYTDQDIKDLFSYRFEKGELAGHNVGNIILAALMKTTGSVEKAIIEAAKILNVRGQVVPVTLFPTLLTAVLKNGKKIVGEHNIDEPAKPLKAPIKKLILTPNGPANKRATTAIMQADAIVFGPGDLYTSVLPNLLAKGVKEAIVKSKAKRIVISNIMTKQGQTDGFKASDFVRVLNQFLGGKNKIDVAIVNSKKPSLQWLNKYKKTHSAFIDPDIKAIEKMGARTVATPLLSGNTFQKPLSDVLQRSFLRHDADKTAKIIWQTINN